MTGTKHYRDDSELFHAIKLFSPALPLLPMEKRPKFVEEVVDAWRSAMMREGRMGDFGFGRADVDMLVVVMKKIA